MIPRLHLFELEDLAWFPATIRDLGTDYIHYVEHRARLHEPIVPLLAEALRETDSNRIVDLCSGGGGPWLAITSDLHAASVDADVVLTDRFPNEHAFAHMTAASGGRISFDSRPIDARDVPTDLRGMRTVCNAFHHFRPADARAILAAAVDSNQPIGVFEIPDRRWYTVLGILLTPLFVWLATPFVRPFAWRRLLWTYLIPVVPLYCLWDGFVSQLRAYKPEELQALVRDLGDGRYRWQAGRTAVRGGPIFLTWLIGLPEKVV